MVDNMLCNMRPMYKKIWPLFEFKHKDLYIFHARKYISWSIGSTYSECNSAGVYHSLAYIVAHDGSSTPDGVTTTWKNVVDSKWRPNININVVCDRECALYSHSAL